MSNTQARLIASALVLVAAAIFYHAQPSSSGGAWAVFLAGSLFVVEYGRALVPEREDRSPS